MKLLLAALGRCLALNIEKPRVASQGLEELAWPIYTPQSCIDGEAALRSWLGPLLASGSPNAAPPVRKVSDAPCVLGTEALVAPMARQTLAG